LSEEERLIRDTARRYAQEQLFPRVLTAYLEERFDRAILNEMGEFGLLGVMSRRNMAAPVSALSPMA
jgi:glutaryl-CoA dehydrogenase